MHKKVELISKRNKVYRLIEDEGKSILKIFSNKDDMEKELTMLQLLHTNGCKVPEVLKITSDSLYLEDLGDMTLLNWLEKSERISSEDILHVITKLADWLTVFYDTISSRLGLNYIMNDVNFRNFLIKDDEIYGIDFEQSKEGEMVEDFGKLAAYALTYDPQMTDWKKKFVKLLIDQLSLKFNISTESIESEMEKELVRINLRRYK